MARVAGVAGLDHALPRRAARPDAPARRARRSRARATSGWSRSLIIVGIWAIPKSYGLENKSNASDLRNDAVPELRKGDLVLSMQPEQGPLLAYHLEKLGGAPDLRFGEPAGRGRRTTASWTGPTATTS